MNILSFDVEDWYMSYDGSQIDASRWSELPGRIRQNLEEILSFLEQHNTLATFYIMGWVAKAYPDVVKLVFSKGHEIGYHSFYHQLPVNQGPELFEKDLSEGLALLEDLIGEKVMHYRAPRFSLCHRTNWSLPILVGHGIKVSSSVKSIRRFGSEKVPTHPFRFSYKGIELLELPLNQASLMGINFVYTGSGYFRILPYPVIKHLYDSSDYNMAYFHPRDFDTAVPKTDLLPFYRNIMSSLGNGTTKKKLGRLIRSNQFITVGRAAGIINESNRKLPILYL